jgi:hypothetical protein
VPSPPKNTESSASPSSHSWSFPGEAACGNGAEASGVVYEARWAVAIAVDGVGGSTNGGLEGVCLMGHVMFSLSGGTENGCA